MHPTLSRFLNRVRSEYVVKLVYQSDFCQAYYIDLSRFRLKVSSKTPLVFCTHSEAATIHAWEVLERLSIVINKIHPGEETISILILEGDATPVLKSAKRSFSDVLILGRNDIENVIDEKNLEKEFLECLRSRLDLLTLSPYQTSNPANGSMFFGREQEVRQLMRREKTSFAVWGMRKVGKTSLLTEVHSRLVEDRNYPEEKVIYIDCGDHTSQYDFIMDVALPVVGFQQAESMDFKMFHSFLRSYSSNGTRPITFLLDEVDNLVEVDVSHGRNLQKVLRSSFKSGYARYVISGFRSARRERQNLDSPLYNFAEDIYLRGLSVEDTRKLIQLPFQDLGLKISEGVTSEIYKETRGQPALIQFVCHQLLEIAQKGKSNSLAESDLAKVYGSPGFKDLTFEFFFQNTNHLERIIVYSQLEKDIFSFSDVLLKLRKDLRVFAAADNVRTAINYLVYIGTLNDMSGTYGFANSRFVDTLISRHDIKMMADSEKEEGAKSNQFTIGHSGFD